MITEMADTPETAALALGKLIGTVDGLARTLIEQNNVASKSRDEFMRVFEGIRSDSKEMGTKIDGHMKDDSIVHNVVLELANWKKDAAPKVDTLWDNKNTQKGAWWASTGIGTILGGFIVAIYEWAKRP